MTRTLFLTLILTAILALPACKQRTTAEDVKKETSEALESVGDYAHDTKEAFTKAVQGDLDRLENEWIRLKEKAKGNSKMEQELAVMDNEIHDKMEETKEQLTKLEDSTSESWDDMRDKVEDSMKDLRKAINDAKNKMS